MKEVRTVGDCRSIDRTSIETSRGNEKSRALESRMHNTYRRHDNFRYTALAVAYRSTYAVRLSNSSLVCERELPSSHIT
ncbi:unnamed protein product, partial [Ixodes persulcatus]